MGVAVPTPWFITISKPKTLCQLRDELIGSPDYVDFTRHSPVHTGDEIRATWRAALMPIGRQKANTLGVNLVRFVRVVGRLIASWTSGCRQTRSR